MFSGLKSARHFLYLLLIADVPKSNHILLKNVRVVRGRMVNAFQSQLLFPPLNCRSRVTTVVNRDLKNIQIFYRSKPLLCSLFCLLLVLKTTLAVLLPHPGTGADPLSNTPTRSTEDMLTCFRKPSNPETNPFWGHVTTHPAICPADAWPFWQDLALLVGLHPPLPFPKRNAPRGLKWKAPKGVAKYFKILFSFWTMDVAVTKVDGKSAGRRRAQEPGLCVNTAQEYSLSFLCCAWEWSRDAFRFLAGSMETTMLKTRKVQF